MSLVALLSAKGSPGVTTAAVALAAAWPAGRCAVVVETDVAGGDLAPTCGLSLEPGLGSLASAGRHGFDSATLLSHTQLLPCGVRAVVAPPSDNETGAALDALTPNLEAAMASGTVDVLADCGRFAYDDAVETMLHLADLAVMVARPTLAGVEHVASRLRILRSMATQVALVLVGERSYPAAEVAEALACEVLGVLADDPRGAQSLLSPGGISTWWLARSSLVRSARAVAGTVASRLPAAPPAASPLSLGERMSLAGPSRLGRNGVKS
ncbi:MAG: hypothetical protein AB1679_14895 [Actinomycetota bacterium]